MSQPRVSNLSAGRIALGYALVALLWIAFSDAAVTQLRMHPAVMTFKGAAFVLVTAALLYFTIRRLARAVQLTSQQRKQAEESLALRSFALNNAHDAVFFVDEQSRLLEINEECCRSLGYTREELLKMRVPDIDPDFPKERWSDHWRTLKAQRSLTFEGRHRAKDGRVFPVEISARYLEYGGRAFNLAIVRDITERKRAEDAEALRQANERMETALRGSSALIWEVEIPDGNLDHAQAFWVSRAEDFGFDPHPPAGIDPIEQLIHPDDRVSAKAAARAYLAGQTAEYEEEVRHVRPTDGSIRTLLVRGVAVRDATGKPIRFAGSAVDITDLKHAEEALRASEARFRALVQNSSDVISLFDAEGTVLYHSPAVERLLGYRTQDRVGRNIFRDPIVHPDDLAPKRAFFEAIRSQPGAPVTSEFRLRHADGSWRQIEAVGQNFLDDPAVAGIVTNYRDVTERKVTEHALQERMKELACLYAVSRDIQADLSIEELCRRAVKHLVPAMQFPEITVPVIEMNGEQFALENYTPGLSCHLQAEIEAEGRVFGHVRVYYAEQKPFAIPEEQNLVNGIADALGAYLERKRAEELLVRERHLFTTLVDNIPDQIYFKDAASRFVRVNKAQATGFGLVDPAEVIGKTDFDFFAERHARPAYEDEQAIIRTGQPVVGKEEEETYLDGRTRWVSTTKMPLRDWTGKIVGTFGVSRDITALKLAEEALRRSRQDLDRAQEVGQIGWWRLDTRRNVLTWSDETHRIFGVPKGTPLAYESFLDIVHPEDRLSVNARWQAGIRGEPYDIQHRIVVDGRVKWVREKAYLEFDGAGVLLGGFGIAQDVTERKQAEEALRASEQRFRVFVDHAVDAFFLHNEQSRIVDVNRRACESLGYTREELIEMDAADFDADLTPARIEELLAGKTVAFESRHRRKDGTVFPVEVRGQGFEEGGRQFFVNLARDITERKRAERALRAAKEAAEAANRAKDEFLANVSHEIRTPMNAILGMTELVLDTPLTEDQRHCLSTVSSAADNLLGMLNDLLDFSKIEAGKLELAPADFSLRTVLGDTLRVLAARARKKGLELVSHLDPDVPDALIGDVGRLRQILLNVAGNAVKFTERGSVRVEVQIIPDDGPVMRGSSRVMLRFRVRDTGIGIPKDKQQRIFRAFEQEDSSTTRRYGGTGLGLTIASRLIGLMGGAIWVESESGHGSTFTFTAQFDRQAVQPESAPGRNEDAAAAPSSAGLDRQAVQPESAPGRNEDTAAAPSSAGLRILVAEDNEFNAQLMLQVLGRLGHRVRIAKNGREALDCTDAGDYDLLLLDIHMPELDGFQVIRAIRDREASAGSGQRLPVIALTASARSQDRDHCLAAGMDDFLAKPIKATQLKLAIERAMGRKARPARAAATPAATDSSVIRASSTGLIDSEVLLGACGGDQVVLDTLCQALRDHLPQQMSALQAAFDAGDTARLRATAHKLCGMVSVFSTTAANTASQIEDHASEDQIEALRPLLDELAELSQQLLQQARDLSIESLRGHA